MSSCAGPYTRVFFNARDAEAIQAFADALVADGMEATRLALPRGRGGIDDLSCDMAFADGAAIRMAKFLGPRRLLMQTHVYEIDFPVGDDGTRRHLFGDRIAEVIKRFTRHRADLMSGAMLADVVSGPAAHETRIDLCNDL